MRRHLAFGLLLFLLAAPVNAEWVFASEDHGGNRWYYSTDAVKPYKEYNRIWLKTVYPQPDNFGDSEVKIQCDFHKKERKFRPLHYVFLGPDGSVREREQLSGRDWKKITAESVFDVIRKASSKL